MEKPPPLCLIPFGCRPPCSNQRQRNVIHIISSGTYQWMSKLLSKSSRVGEGKKSAFDCATSIRLMPPNSSQIFAHSNGECLLGIIESNPVAEPNTFLQIFYGPDDNPGKVIIEIKYKYHSGSQHTVWLGWIFLDIPLEMEQLAECAARSTCFSISGATSTVSTFSYEERPF